MRVVIVDDEEPARRRLDRMLQRIDGVEVVGMADGADEARRMIAREHPDAVLCELERVRSAGEGRAVDEEHITLLLEKLQQLTYPHGRRQHGRPHRSSAHQWSCRDRPGASAWKRCLGRSVGASSRRMAR